MTMTLTCVSAYNKSERKKCPTYNGANSRIHKCHINDAYWFFCSQQGIAAHGLHYDLGPGCNQDSSLGDACTQKETKNLEVTTWGKIIKLPHEVEGAVQNFWPSVENSETLSKVVFIIIKDILSVICKFVILFLASCFSLYTQIKAFTLQKQ